MLAAFTADGNRHAMAQALAELNLMHTLALLDTRRGAHETALPRLRGGHAAAERSITAALEIFVELGDYRGAGLATLSSGRLLADQHRHAAALDPLRRSLTLLSRAGLTEAHQRAQAELLRSTQAAGSA